jgi:hypothetical protein
MKTARRGQREQQRALARHRQTQCAIESVPTRRQPREQRRHVGHERQRRGEQQQHRRIAVVIGVEGRAHHRLLENDSMNFALLRADAERLR